MSSFFRRGRRGFRRRFQLRVQRNHSFQSRGFQPNQTRAGDIPGTAAYAAAQELRPPGEPGPGGTPGGAAPRPVPPPARGQKPLRPHKGAARLHPPQQLQNILR